jgi:hypothetical protein
MKVTAKVELNMANIAKLQESAEKAMPKFMDAFKTEVELAQVIPREHGDLMGSSFTVVQGKTAYLCYGAIYARRLYFNPQYNFRMDKHVNARGRWLDEWIYGPKLKWVTDTFLEKWKQEAGGLIK